MSSYSLGKSIVVTSLFSSMTLSELETLTLRHQRSADMLKSESTIPMPAHVQAYWKVMIMIKYSKNIVDTWH